MVPKLPSRPAVSAPPALSPTTSKIPAAFSPPAAVATLLATDVAFCKTPPKSLFSMA